MKKIDLGQAIGILANVGVIASIVFLGIELRNSGRQAQIATSQEMVAQRTEWREFIASDEALTDIYMRGLNSFRQLTPLERERFDLLMRSFMHKISVSINARSADLVSSTIPDLDRRVIEGELFRMLDEPGFREWWALVDRRAIPENVITMTDELDALKAERDAGR